ncbi:unnamed protein product, partial [Urochloa humidicola]
DAELRRRQSNGLHGAPAVADPHAARSTGSDGLALGEELQRPPRARRGAPAAAAPRAARSSSGSARRGAPAAAGHRATRELQRLRASRDKDDSMLGM